ncbi:MAG: hypothetical protein HC854_09165 [Flavobacterium sp.]|nr:hypothetical protein [Flavobacterium sp.]
MAISTSISIQIAGEKLTRFSKLVIHQKVHTHHKFSLLQPIPKEFVEQSLEKAQSYMGQPIKIEIESNNLRADAPMIFYGVVTESQLVRTSGAAGGIIINGYSPSIVMETVPNIVSFSKQTFSTIINKIASKYSQKEVQPKVTLKNDSILSYTVQYGESDFGFLCRMAKKKGEWFYYNGEETFFGKPATSKTINLEYGRNLHSFNIEMRVKAFGFEYVGYDPSSAETNLANSTEINYQPQGFSKPAFDASKRLFPGTSTLLYSNAIEEGNSRSHLLDRVQKQVESRAADLVTAKGESDETGIRVGDIITIQQTTFSLTGNVEDGLKEQNYGSYLVTDITHYCDETGSYHNTFDAVPADVLAPPYGNVHSVPLAETQPAIVVDNNDPKGLSRIQVQFPWQTPTGDNTPWIRVTTPYAGKGKGFHVLPEIGEEVLVDFEGGNAEKPVVIGTMFHGAGKSGHGGSGNFMKGFQTATGNRLQMDDNKGSIYLSDQGTANMLFDGAGNATTNANATNTINVGKGDGSVMKMDSDGNITLDGKTSLTITIGSSKLEMKEDGTITFNGKILLLMVKISKQLVKQVST